MIPFTISYSLLLDVCNSKFVIRSKSRSFQRVPPKKTEQENQDKTRDFGNAPDAIR